MSSYCENNNFFYIKSVYCLFIFVWILLVFLNHFYNSYASLILIVPLIIFIIGFFNCELFNENLETDVFKVTFIGVGLLLSLPLLKLFNEKNEDKQLNHIIFLAMISVLLSYYHIWVPIENRQICKIIQSCLETYAITLYIFAILIFFMK